MKMKFHGSSHRLPLCSFIVLLLLASTPSAVKLKDQGQNARLAHLHGRDMQLHFRQHPLAPHQHHSELHGGGASGGTEFTAREVTPGLLLAFLAGAATSLGAAALPCLPPGGPPPVMMAFAMSLAAGVMVSVSAEMVWPHLAVLAWFPIGLFVGSGLLCFTFCRLTTLWESNHHHHHHHFAARSPDLEPESALESAKDAATAAATAATTAATTTTAKSTSTYPSSVLHRSCSWRRCRLSIRTT